MLIRSAGVWDSCLLPSCSLLTTVVVSSPFVFSLELLRSITWWDLIACPFPCSWQLAQRVAAFIDLGFCFFTYLRASYFKSQRSQLHAAFIINILLSNLLAWTACVRKKWPRLKCGWRGWNQPRRFQPVLQPHLGWFQPQLKSTALGVEFNRIILILETGQFPVNRDDCVCIQLVNYVGCCYNWQRWWSSGIRIKDDHDDSGNRNENKSWPSRSTKLIKKIFLLSGLLPPWCTP